MSKVIGYIFAVLYMFTSVAALTPSDMSLAMFRSGRIKDPTVFKVKIAVASDGYYGSLDDVRDKFWALKVDSFTTRSNTGDNTLYCYAKKDSPAGKVVAEKLKDGAYHAANVSLRYSKNELYKDCCVIDAIEFLAAEAMTDVVAKFSSTRISVTKNDQYDILQGKIGVSLRTSLKYFKKPVLRVVLLTEENGSRVVRDCIIDEPNVKMVSHSDSLDRNTTTAGNEDNEPPRWQRYIEEISTSQSEVSKENYKVLSYEGLPLGEVLRKGVKGGRWVHIFGYSKFDKDENAKMLGYRIEMWYNGACIGIYDSIKPSLIKRLQIPSDWYVSFKHPEKFKYRSPFSRKNVVRQ